MRKWDGLRVLRNQRGPKDDAFSTLTSQLGRSRIDLQKWSSRINLHIWNTEDAANAPGKRSSDVHLHLHSFKHNKFVAYIDVVAWLHCNGHHDGWRRGT